MKKLFARFSAVGLALVFSISSMFGQGFPLPQAQTDTSPAKACPGCPAVRTNSIASGAPVVDPVWKFTEPIVAFTGRYLDSAFTSDWQFTFRTGRAWEISPAPTGLPTSSPIRDRIYSRIGSAVFAYDAKTFFSRLNTREDLMKSTSFPLQAPNQRSSDATTERFLRPDAWFYSEYSGSGWQAAVVDVQQRMWMYDVDDRGYVYIAHGDMGWGIVKDDGLNGGTLMPTFYQDVVNKVSEADAVFVLKSGTTYYAFTGSPSSDTYVWDVTNPSSPQRLRKLAMPTKRPARTSTHVARIEANMLRISTIEQYTSGLAGTNYTAPRGASYTAVISDGTNFFATTAENNGTWGMTVFSPNSSGGFSTADYTFPQTFFANELTYHDGYIGANGLAGVAGSDAYLIKLSALKPSVIDFGGFFNDHYVAPPAGYRLAHASRIAGFQPYVYNGKVYVMVGAFTRGDVFEVRVGDGLIATLRGTIGGTNQNAIPRTAGDVYYGDKVEFTSATTASTPKTVQWTFGNPEADAHVGAGADPNTSPSTSTGTLVSHRYSGLTTANVGTRTAQVTDSNGTVATVPVTLKVPVARIGVQNTLGKFQTLITQGGTTTLPIVTDDSFYDGSDGDADGHFNSWKIETSATPIALKAYDPADASKHLFPVGACGQHTLEFSAHYGPFSSSFAPIGTDFKVELTPSSTGARTVTYTVRPFAAYVDAPSDAGANLVFKSLSRTAATLAAQQVSYQWDLVDSNDTVVVTGPKSATGEAVTVATIPNWNLNKTQITVRGLRARLKITMAGAAATCTGMTEHSAYSQALNPPDGELKGGCASDGGPPCSFNVTSKSGVNMITDGWHFAWTVNDPSAVSNNATDAATYAPNFTKVGNYTMQVIVSNTIGSQTLTLPVSVLKAGPTCQTMTDSNIFIAYAGGNCVNGGICTAGNVNFSISTWGAYNLSCANHTYRWSNGSTGATTSMNLTNGSHTITCDVSNGSQTKTLSVNVQVGGQVTPPTPTPPVNPPTPPVNPPTPGGCAQMTQTNLFLSFVGQGCVNGGTCAPGVASLSVASWGYNLGCANHTYQWSNGATTPTTTITLAPGTVTPSVTVSNGTQNITLTATINVSGGTTPPTPTPPVTPPTPGPTNPPTGCMPMNNNTIFVAYSAPSGCSFVNNNACKANEVVTFSAAPASGYNFSCTAHSFSWNFGDGTPAGSGLQVTHSFAAAGQKTVTLTVTRGSETFTSPVTINIDGLGATPTVEASIDAVTFGRDTVYKFTPKIVPADAPGIAFYVWNFGDGTTTERTSGSDVYNEYRTAGTYTVTLKLLNAQRVELGQASKTVTISLPGRRRPAR